MKRRANEQTSKIPQFESLRTGLAMELLTPACRRIYESTRKLMSM